MQACKHFIGLVTLPVVCSCRWHCSRAIINWCLCTIWRSVAQHSCNAVRWSESGKRQGSRSSPCNSSDCTVNKSFLCQTRPMNCFILTRDAIPRQFIFKMVHMINFNEIWKLCYLHNELQTRFHHSDYKWVTNACIIVSENLIEKFAFTFASLFSDIASSFPWLILCLYR